MSSPLRDNCHDGIIIMVFYELLIGKIIVTINLETIVVNSEQVTIVRMDVWRQYC